MKKMKRFSAMAAALALSVSAAAFAFPASAEDDVIAEQEVYVNIINDHGDHMLYNEPVELEDADGDGALTINDALYIAHENNYEGGAEAGYGSKNTDWGLSLTKLWGIENGGSYGYYVDGNMAMGLTDTLKGGEYIDAFCYSDTETYSDKYSYFDKRSADIDLNEETTLELTLNFYNGYDENWMPVLSGLSDAVITIDDEETEFRTDENGKVTVDLSDIDTGWHYISAKADKYTIVPPMCEVDVTDSSQPEPTDDTVTVKMNVVGNQEDLKLINTDVSVYDFDKDGKLTVYDAIAVAHEDYYENGGAEAGFAVDISDTLGTYISKLWGYEGRCGFALNDKSDKDIYSEIKDDDYLMVYAYRDTENYSDKYAYFEEKEVFLNYGDNEVTLHMKKLVYNEQTGEYEAVAAANVGVDYIGDREPELYTDENGEVTITIADDNRGATIALGLTDEEYLVMPVSYIWAEEEPIDDGDDIYEDMEDGEIDDGEEEEEEEEEGEDDDAEDISSDGKVTVKSLDSKKGNPGSKGGTAGTNNDNPKTGNTADVIALTALLAAGVITAAKKNK
ncbi:MAG: hypothetical protein IJ740_00490 [Ruminococcus sp.]|nr:hypothetical protein [Ruminococcus sp.]